MIAALELTDGELVLKILLLLNLVGTAVVSWRTLTGRKSQTEIGPQPLEVMEAHQAVTRETLDPVIQRVSVLETEVRVIRAKMDADKHEILERIDHLRNDSAQGFRAIERAIGRLEGGQR